MTLTLPGGKRRDLYLGAYGSAKSREAYLRKLKELGPAVKPTRSFDRLANMSVVEVLLAFLEHAERHYRRADGTQTHEVSEYKLTIRLVRSLYGSIPASSFDVLALKTIRQAMIDGDLKVNRRPWARKLVNQRIGRVQRIFKWAASEKLVPAATYFELTTMSGLEAGRSAARETDPIRPLSDDDIDGALPFLSRHVRGMVEFQRYTGCRPGEACSLRWTDIDRGGRVWLFRPGHHKLTHKGKSRIVAIGPKALAVLAAFPTEDPEGFVFSPCRCVEESRAARSTARLTPRYSSRLARNATKRKLDPRRRPGVRYQTAAYGHAVKTAVERANKAGVKVTHWHPNQLRHAFATRVRQE